MPFATAVADPEAAGIVPVEVVATGVDRLELELMLVAAELDPAVVRPLVRKGEGLTAPEKTNGDDVDVVVG